jgi:hypothetical protein
MMEPGLSAFEASLRDLQPKQAEDHDLRVFTRPKSNWMHKATFPTCRDRNASTSASVVAAEFVHQCSPASEMSISLRKHRRGFIDVALALIALAAAVAAFMILYEEADEHKRKLIPELQSLS